MRLKVYLGPGRQALVRRCLDTVLLASLLAYGVVGAEHLIHTFAFGGRGGPLQAQLLHWLGDGLLAFPLAIAAVWGGLRLAQRLRLTERLVARAATVSGLFAVLLVPSVGVHSVVIHHNRTVAFGGLEGATSVFGLLAHGLRDATLSLVVAIPLAALALLMVAQAPRARWSSRFATAGGSFIVLFPLLALLTVLANSGNVRASQTRTYFIAADEVDWDYAPSGRNLIGAQFDENFAVYTENVQNSGLASRIGRVNRKSLYREYTDGTFRNLKSRPSQWEHLGALGPVVRAEVGDTIRFVFKNNTRFPASVHPHGVFYLKNAEGAPYNDGTGGGDKADDSVQPGQTFTYVWQVPERAGPGWELHPVDVPLAR